MAKGKKYLTRQVDIILQDYATSGNYCETARDVGEREGFKGLTDKTVKALTVRNKEKLHRMIVDNTAHLVAENKLLASKALKKAKQLVGDAKTAFECVKIAGQATNDLRLLQELPTAIVKQESEGELDTRLIKRMSGRKAVTEAVEVAEAVIKAEAGRKANAEGAAFARACKKPRTKPTPGLESALDKALLALKSDKSPQMKKSEVSIK